MQYEMNEISKVLGEDETARTANTQTFVLENGDRKLVCYSSDKFYPNYKKGIYSDVKNYFSCDNEMKIRSIQDNEFVTEVCENPKDNTLYSVRMDTTSVKLVAESCGMRKAKVTRLCMEKDDPATYASADYTASKTALYPEVFGNSGFSVTQIHKRLLNAVLVPHRLVDYRFCFSLVCENGYPIYEKEDDKVVIKSSISREKLFVIYPLGIVDARGREYGTLEWHFDKRTGHITFGCGAEMLNREGIAFPVKLLFSLEYPEKKLITCQSYDEEASAAQACFQHSIYQDVHGRHGVKLRVEIPSLPKNAKIVDAFLELRGQQCREGDVQFAVYPSIREKGKLSIPSKDRALCDIGVFVSEKEVLYKINVKNLIEQKAEGKIKPVEIFILPLSYGNQATLFGMHSEQGEYRLTVIYNDEPQKEEYTREYRIGDLGRASVNALRGNISFNIPILDNEDAPLFLQAALMYDSKLSDSYDLGEQPLSHRIGSPTRGRVGKGWQFSLFSKMNGGIFAYRGQRFFGYIITLPNGRSLRFKENRELEPRYSNEAPEYEAYYLYSDFDGKGYVYDPYTCQLSAGGEQYDFNYAGCVSQIIKEDDICKFEYKNGLLQKISDSRGRYLNLFYDDNGFLVKMITNSEKQIDFYYKDGCLLKICYPSGKKLLFTYADNAEHLPTRVSVISPNGKVIQCLKFSSKDSRITEVMLAEKTQFQRITRNAEMFHYMEKDGETAISIVGDFSWDHIVLDSKGQIVFGGDLLD